MPQWGALIIIGKGLTPIPYKLVTITSGFAGYNIWLFILCSMIARGGALLHRCDPVQPLWRRHPGRIERHLGLWVSLGAALLLLGFVVAYQTALNAAVNGLAGSPLEVTLDVMLDRSGNLFAPLQDTGRDGLRAWRC